MTQYLRRDFAPVDIAIAADGPQATAMVLDGLDAVAWREGDAVRVQLAPFARTGVQTYGDGKRTWGEYRDADEVFDDDSLASWSGVPITLGHPPALIDGEPGRITQYARGSASSLATIDREEGLVRISMTITDPDAIAAIESGTRQLSGGYRARIVADEGTYRGERYAARQTDIRGDHIAIVERGRAGPRVAIPPLTEAPGADGNDMTKDTDEKVDVAGLGAQLAAAVSRADAAETSHAAEVAAHEATQAKLDAAMAQVEQAKADAASYRSVVAQASEVLDTLDGLDTVRDIRVAVVDRSGHAPDDIGSRSDEYVAAAYDIAYAALKARSDASEGNRSKLDSLDSRTREPSKLAQQYAAFQVGGEVTK